MVFALKPKTTINETILPLTPIGLKPFDFLALTSCNSKKKAAQAEKQQLEQKYQQADRDKAIFQNTLPAATQ